MCLGTFFFTSAYGIMRSDLRCLHPSGCRVRMHLHGQILPVGGVEDKLEAAQQAGATLALIPQENWREVYREIEVVPVGDAETLLRRVFPPGEGATLSEGMEFLVGQEIG